MALVASLLAHGHQPITGDEALTQFVIHLRWRGPACGLPLGRKLRQELRIKGIDVPTRVIPSLATALRRRARYRVPQSDSLAPDALPVPLPSYVSDARVVSGALTLYRAASGPATRGTSSPRNP